MELQSIAQAWSEHCCYKSPRSSCASISSASTTRDVLSKGDAGVMEFDDEYGYALRIESHNHPSAIEPYGGAATGIGGIVRDVLCMGAQPIALIDPLFFGPIDYKGELPAGSKTPKYLVGGVVAGIRDYGNRIGIPTVCGGLYFDESYLGNCLVNVGCVGIVKKKDLLNNAVGGVDDYLILCGGRTGRDGIHGVTFASAELSSKSEDESRGAGAAGRPDHQGTAHPRLPGSQLARPHQRNEGPGRRRAVLRGRRDGPVRRMRRGGRSGPGPAEGERAGAVGDVGLGIAGTDDAGGARGERGAHPGPLRPVGRGRHRHRQGGPGQPRHPQLAWACRSSTWTWSS